ncbi:MAG: VWA domain-containing protein, partial [Cyanobacteria bacterium P01_D01_bin.56]
MKINPEHVRNREPRCPLILLLDTSGSMIGNPIQQLNQGLITLQQEILESEKASDRVELAIVGFGESATLQQPFVIASDFEPPTLTADGSTPMGAGLTMALDILKQELAEIKNSGIKCYRPWLVLITDGKPTDAWEASAERVRKEIDKGTVLLFVIAVEGADMNILKQIASPELPPAKLN